MDNGVTMPIAILTSGLFMSVASVFIAYFFFRYRFQSKTLDSLQTALQSGSELIPAIANTLEIRTDLRRGVVSIAKALATALLGIGIMIGAAGTNDAEDARSAMWILFGVAAFPGLFGIALIGFHLFDARSSP
jgi:hypothetical protein